MLRFYSIRRGGALAPNPGALTVCLSVRSSTVFLHTKTNFSLLICAGTIKNIVPAGTGTMFLLFSFRDVCFSILRILRIESCVCSVVRKDRRLAPLAVGPSVLWQYSTEVQVAHDCTMYWFSCATENIPKKKAHILPRIISKHSLHNTRIFQLQRTDFPGLPPKKPGVSNQ
jgi:hypothetical protein